MRFAFFIAIFCCSAVLLAQDPGKQSFSLFGDVTVTIDAPDSWQSRRESIIVLYALPNGNTTAQTIGKKLAPGDDWHFDIQHIGAQTRFVRAALPQKNIVVVYLENSYKSWPQWKTKHPGYVQETQQIVDTVFSFFGGKKTLYLNGHSGGGRFIFNFLDGLKEITASVQNISFLDSNYGYDSSYLKKLATWLRKNKNARLNVFAYNDSLALLNGKQIVSDTGGTWFRSGLMLRHLSPLMIFEKTREDSLIVYRSLAKRVNFYLRTNPEQKIYHTIQVERNGFIHSLLAGTREEEKGYRYFGNRAYTQFISGN